MYLPSSFQRSTLKLALVSACVIGSLGYGSAALAATATAATSGTVVQPIAITKVADLAFGKFAAVTGGSVTVSTSGVRTVGGAVVVLSGISTTAARFDVTGDTTATYSIALTGTTVLTSGSDTMAFAPVSQLSAGGAVSGNVTSGALTAGAGSIFVGGVLTVASAQPPGAYTGTVIATVEYN